MCRFLLTVLEHTWHVDCVRCHHCHAALDSKCFFRDNNIFCREDFYRCIVMEINVLLPDIILFLTIDQSLFVISEISVMY